MKGLYTIWIDWLYLDKAIDAGIDTLIISAYDFGKNTPTSNHFDSYETIMSTIDRYKGRVKVILLPVWLQEWLDIPEDQRFVQNGVSNPKIPCQTSQVYTENRIREAIELYQAGRIDGIYFDIEEYGTNNVHIFKDKLRCECPRCKGTTWETQYKIHKSHMVDLGCLPESGEMPYNEWWNVDQYPSKPRYVLTAETYNYIDFGRKLDLWWHRFKSRWMNNTNYKIVAGIFLETHTEDQFFEMLKKADDSRLFDGWWIYPQKRLSRYSKIPDVPDENMLKETGYYDTSLVNDQFFERLKQYCKK